MLKQEIKWIPSFDRRDPDPNKNYGIHGMDIIFYIHGDKGSIQFKIFTNWHSKELTKELNHRSYMDGYIHYPHKPMAADLGYHSKTPQYEGQKAYSCDLMPEGFCYYDGSTLNAEQLFDKFVVQGIDIVWQEMTEMYKDLFKCAE